MPCAFGVARSIASTCALRKGAPIHWWLCATGKQLVRRLVEAMRDREAEEVVLEAEVSNAGALALYESLGFIRDKRLQRCASAADHTALIQHDGMCHA